MWIEISDIHHVNPVSDYIKPPSLSRTGSFGLYVTSINQTENKYV